MVAQVLKVVVIINLIIIDHSRMIQAFRIIEISKYDDGGQLATRGRLMQESSNAIISNSSKFARGAGAWELCPSPLCPSVYQRRLAMGQKLGLISLKHN